MFDEPPPPTAPLMTPGRSLTFHRLLCGGLYLIAWLMIVLSVLFAFHLPFLVAFSNIVSSIMFLALVAAFQLLIELVAETRALRRGAELPR